MRKHFHSSIWALGIFCLLVYFTNCDPTEQTVLSSASSAPDCFLDDSVSCFTADDKRIELRVNSPRDITVNSTQTAINIGGDCNSGGYSNNIIQWEIYLNGGLKKRSADMGLSGKCLNGRFALFVKLPTGLDTGTGSKAKHDLDVEILGLDNTGRSHKNSVLGRKRINLYPSTN